MTILSAVNLALSSLAVLGQALIVLILVSLIARYEKLVYFFGRNAVLFSFIVVLIATLGSLFYSEIAGYEPCKLCWFQRIFMYPQVALLGIALWKKNEMSAIYNGLTLSIIGLIIAGYHYLLQNSLAPALPCSAVGYSAACSQRFVMQFGYITITLMAFTAFAVVILFLTARKFYNRRNELSRAG